MEKIKKIVVYFLLSLLLCSCMEKKEIDREEINEEELNKGSNEEDENKNENVGEFIALFKEKYPKITIIRECEYYLEDGTYVYAFLYSNPGEYVSTTNICFVTEQA